MAQVYEDEKNKAVSSFAGPTTIHLVEDHSGRLTEETTLQEESDREDEDDTFDDRSFRPSLMEMWSSAGKPLTNGRRHGHRPSMAQRVTRRLTLMNGLAKASVEKHLDPEETEEDLYEWCTLVFFLGLQVLSFGTVVLTRAFPTYAVTLFITASTSLLMWLYTKILSTKTRAERILHILGMVVLLTTSLLLLVFVTSPCSHCIYYWASNAMASDFTSMQEGRGNQPPRLGVAWDLLLGGPSDSEQPGQDEFFCACRKCVSSIFASFLTWRRTTTPALLVDNEDGQLQEKHFHTDSMMDGTLASWYLDHNNRTTAARKAIINQKLAKALAADGRLRDDELAEILQELLCTEASRVDNPDPNVFLSQLKRARFTGEQGGVNISTSKLQSIMRGDILKELGVALCFNLRFALFVPEDTTLEKHAISFTQLFPITNEEGMRAEDRTHALPFFITPGIDQDIDIDGSNMKRIERLVDIFVKFPFNDEPLYFETHDEYYAFYRWELGSTIQDEWFFPQWFLHTEKAADFTQFQAKKQLHSNEHIALEDPYSDRTLGDRVFYGTAQEFLTAVKFPGINEDYEYQFPNGPHTFMTEEHRERFRYANKPSSEQLLDMIYSFWPKEEKKGRKRGDNPEQLARYKNRILEIDYASWASIETREAFNATGGILYLDPKSKLPMGFWESHRKYMYLPTDPDWEHAKYYFRVMERVVLATRHVIESHLGWAQPITTASWQTLPPTHGLRILLKPFTLHTHSINWSAYHMLARNHSLLNHASGFTQKGYTEIFMDIWKDFNFSQTIPEQFQARKLDRAIDPNTLDFYKHGRSLWDIHREFVNNFVHLLFPTDEAMLEDDSVVRFWHHTNTYGRLLDPCVCGLESDKFFDKSAWPGFESTYTCQQMLDHIGYKKSEETIIRRRDWCAKTKPFHKVMAMRKVLESHCESNPECDYLPYGIYGMRADMGLKELKSRSQLIDYITRVIWEITFRHKWLSDNLPYFADGKYCGVRMREFGPDGKRSTMIDVGSYVFATSIGGLTSVRAPPLLADWTPLYSHYAAKQTGLSGEQRKHLFEALDTIHKNYKFKLLDLSIGILDESIARPLNQRWNTMNPATHASSVAI